MTDDTKSTASDTSGPTQSKAAGKRRLMVLAVIVVVLLVSGVGGWIWHEQPSFCNAFCHVPMDKYYDTFSATSGAPTADKYGNTVADASGMLAVTHREAGEDCLACHVPTISEMASEGIAWVSGDYYFPLSERTLSDLTEARKLPDDEFCLNSSCHHLDQDSNVITTREELTKASSDLPFNVHDPHHDEFACSDCHKAHRASVDICANPGCHQGAAPVPPGWLNALETSEIVLFLADPE